MCVCVCVCTLPIVWGTWAGTYVYPGYPEGVSIEIMGSGGGVPQWRQGGTAYMYMYMFIISAKLQAGGFRAMEKTTLAMRPLKIKHAPFLINSTVRSTNIHTKNMEIS